MKKITRTYLSGCEWCGATGRVPNEQQGYTTTVYIDCPVCKGQRTITITEVEEEVEARVLNVMPILTSEKLIEDMKNMPMKIAMGWDWLEKRTATGLSLRQVSAFTDLSVSTISRIENGKNVMASTITKLQTFYNSWKTTKYNPGINGKEK